MATAHIAEAALLRSAARLFEEPGSDWNRDFALGSSMPGGFAAYFYAASPRGQEEAAAALPATATSAARKVTFLSNAQARPVARSCGGRRPLAPRPHRPMRVQATSMARPASAPSQVPAVTATSLLLPAHRPQLTCSPPSPPAPFWTLAAPYHFEKESREGQGRELRLSDDGGGGPWRGGGGAGEAEAEAVAEAQDLTPRLAIQEEELSPPIRSAPMRWPGPALGRAPSLVKPSRPPSAGTTDPAEAEARRREALTRRSAHPTFGNKVGGRRVPAPQAPPPKFFVGRRPQAKPPSPSPRDARRRAAPVAWAKAPRPRPASARTRLANSAELRLG